MNFTCRLLVRLATIALLLAVPAGAAAQTTDEEPISVELAAPSLCGVDISSVGTLGTWQWDGTTWVNPSAPNRVAFTAAMLNMPLAGCEVTVEFTGLTGPGGDIPPANFQVASEGVPVGPDTWSAQVGRATPNYFFTFAIESIPDGVTEPGTYSGTVKVDVTNAA